MTPDGEQVITAKSGALAPSLDGKQLRLIVNSGMEYRERPGAAARVVRFDNIAVDEPFDITLPPARKRGSTERELTYGELAKGAIEGRSAGLKTRVMTAELGGRLVRCLSVPFLPLLAFPLGMAAKRRGRGAGLVIAAVLLLGFHHAVQFGESLGDAGRVDAALAVWLPFAIFVALCSWLFSQSLQRPGQNPFTFAFDAVGDVIDRLIDMIRKRLPWLGDGG
jgi:lipopolysaccharide export system permease protein